MRTASIASTDSPSRRDFLARLLPRFANLSPSRAAAPAVAAHPPASTDPTDELIFMSATKLAGLIRSGKISASEAVEAFIRRQEQVNDRLNAVVTNCFERARSEAARLDAKAARGEFAGPLHGVPMTIKDSFDTQGVISTGGTYGRQQYLPEEDATVVARLRRSGAILLGKTNTPEFTLGGLAGISTAGNLLHGSSHNPYDLTRSTGVSSGGAAAIVAAGGSAFDIGSDWAGSIRGPSHNTGIVGIKPTSGRVPRTGHIVDYGGMYDSWQQFGPMCRRVEDIAFITPLIAGPDERDPACFPVPWRDPGAVALGTLRVGFSPDTGPATDSATRETMRQVVAWLEEAAASVREDVPQEILDDLSPARSRMMNGDGWAFYRRLADKWGTHNISPAIMDRMRTRPPVTSAELVEAWERHDDAVSRMHEWMASYDVYLCPDSNTPAAVIDRRPGGGRSGGSGEGVRNLNKGVFNSTGWPVVVVRCGSSGDGRLPIGVQVVAPSWREDICIAVAAYLERRSGGWQRPPI